MTKEEYEVYVDLFETEGWKIFQESIKEAEEQLVKSAPENAPTNDAWQFIRGQVQQLRNIGSYETYIKLSYENQLNDLELEDA